MFALFANTATLAAQSTLYHSDAFAITDSSVRQGAFEAVARSRDMIVSSYPRSGREVHYKFSINAEDNEFPPGTEHTLFLRPRNHRIATPVHTFGVRPPPPIPTPEESGGSEDGTAQVTFSVDMRRVMRAFGERGSYKPPNGSPIRATDFNAVYVIGDTEPLTWNARSLKPGSPLQLTDSDGDSIYSVTLPIETSYTRPIGRDGLAVWERRLDLSRFPQLTSSQRLIDALYRMSLEELQQLVRDDGALSAGAKWPGVWTRDVALSSVLGLAFVAPDAVRTSLLAKVDSAGRIIQDTGTGGSWPVSTDRMAWALAAWEVYATTGDRGWLRTSYDIIRRSAQADLHAAFDHSTGLFRGESSFLDWREQSYPQWMDPKDIYQSQSLGTNAIHYASYRILANMARELGEPFAQWNDVAESVRRGMNAHLWQPRLGWYGQYRYGRNFASLSPRAEGLGEALSIIYGVSTSTQRTRISRSAPLVQFGTPTFWPYIPDMPLYHNGSIWPFVNAYSTWAAAEAGNTAAVEHGLASIYRPAALFLTNKENMVAATGHFEGTVLNSDRQLWSVAGNLATVYRVLFGMRLQPDRLAFHPMVPVAYTGERTLRNLHYRDAVLTVIVRGFGNAAARARLDGRRLDRAEVPARLAGSHTLEIDMNGQWPADRINVVENRVAPATPVAALHGDTLVWSPVMRASLYRVHCNGRPIETTTRTSSLVRPETNLTEYQVLAVDTLGIESFLSQPIRVVPDSSVLIAKPSTETLERQYAGFSGKGYLRLTRELHTTVSISVNIPLAGLYSVDVRYANGSGPVNSSDKNAVRTLMVDGKQVGVLVLPQRGMGLWTDWGYSNAVTVQLSLGAHVVTIMYTALDQNMNRTENTAFLDHLRATRIVRAGRS